MKSFAYHRVSSNEQAIEAARGRGASFLRSEEHTSELQSPA